MARKHEDTLLESEPVSLFLRYKVWSLPQDDLMTEQIKRLLQAWN